MSARVTLSPAFAVSTALGVFAADPSAGSAANPSAVSAMGASARAGLTVRGSVRQVYVVGARARQRVALLNRRGRVVQTRRVASLAGIIYRGVKPGPGYRVRPAGGRRSRPVTVMPDRPAPPNKKIYGQRIATSGYG